MSEIAVNTLVIVGQAVATQVRELRSASTDDGAAPEIEILLEEGIEATDALERAYDAASRTILNLSPYDQLVKG